MNVSTNAMPSKAHASTKNTGKIVQVIGPTVDVEFQSGQLPSIYNALSIVDKAREINRLIKEKGPKGISSQTQGEAVRVNGKKRDDLQATIALIKGADLGIPVQFENFRD